MNRSKRPIWGDVPMILQLSHLQTFIDQFHILQDVTFEVPEGEVTVILGRNGAGKTTTLRTIMGLPPLLREASNTEEK